MDGGDPLPDKDAGPGQYRDESACARVQLEALDENSGDRPNDAGDESLRALFSAQISAILARSQPLCDLISKNFLPAWSRLSFNTIAVIALINVVGRVNDRQEEVFCFYTVWAGYGRECEFANKPVSCQSPRQQVLAMAAV